MLDKSKLIIDVKCDGIITKEIKKTVIPSGEYKKNKYIWRGVMERQYVRHKGEQT